MKPGPKTAHLIFPCGAKLPVMSGALAHILALQNTGNIPFGLCVYHTINRPDRPVLEQYRCEATLPAPCISGCPIMGPHRKFNRLSDIDEWRSMVLCQPLREEAITFTVEKKEHRPMTDNLQPTPPIIEKDGFQTVHPEANKQGFFGEPDPQVAEVPANAVYVVFDTETNGLLLFRDKETGEPVPADDPRQPRQPRLASAAFILADEFGKEISREKLYVRPDGWSMPQGFDESGKPRAGQINGLTDEFLTENGVPVAQVLDLWESYIKAGLIAAAHNAQFDAKMMRSELRRAGRDDLFEQTKQTCTMRGCKPYKEAGMPIKRGQYVKLADACKFFSIDLIDAHDAMADAEACRAILVRLIADGNVIEPQVHYHPKHQVGKQHD